MHRLGNVSPLRRAAPLLALPAARVPARPAQDPSVMGASLCALHDLVALDPAPFRNLVPSLCSILKQVCALAQQRQPRSAPAHSRPAR